MKKLTFIAIVKKTATVNKVNVGLIGYGYWGVNLLRNIVESQYSEKVFVCDSREEKIRQALNIYSAIGHMQNWKELITNADVDAIVIATPTSSHFEIAKAALENGKHVLVEKPLVTSTLQAKELIKIATENKLILMVDHTFLYNDVVRKMKSYVTGGHIGKINYIDSTRLNLGIYQKDVNVLWDLACHDISVVNYIVEEKPSHVRAIGKLHPIYATEDIAYMFLYYPSGSLVQISTSWASPVKIRKMIVGGEKKMMIYDDIEPTNKLIIYDYEAIEPTDENKQMVLVDYRLGNISIPKYQIIEPLKMVLGEFFECIGTGSKPLSDGACALQIVDILEKAEESLKLNGQLIALN